MTTETITTAMPDIPQAARLHLARWMAGYDQGPFAAELAISRNTVAQYEDLDWHGKRKRAFVRAWAEATGMPFEWLAGDVPPSGDGSAQIHRHFGHADGFGRLLPFRPRIAA